MSPEGVKGAKATEMIAVVVGWTFPDNDRGRQSIFRSITHQEYSFFITSFFGSLPLYKYRGPKKSSDEKRK